MSLLFKMSIIPKPNHLYRHFKGNVYQVVDVARSSDNIHELSVVYRYYRNNGSDHLIDNTNENTIKYGSWYRKLDDWNQVVTDNVNRFSLLHCESCMCALTVENVSDFDDTMNGLCLECRKEHA